ncbi:MAG: dihydrolipoyl dehydrogenase [Betaproteobacteria bacterium]|nr:dihydrolipoyl dehydrogenase [Betaproteobacteria bacterium]
MTQIEVDVAIIGAGTAGMSAYRAALKHTRNVVVIEGGAYGTTCARVGCMPSKLLIAAADAAHAISRAPQFGVRGGTLHVDGTAVMKRVREERDRFVGFVTDEVARWPQQHWLRGQARFVDAHTLDVGGHSQVRAQRVVIATGSRAAVPGGWRETLGDRLLVSDDVFAWQTLPASVAVVGTGIIGLELAQALHRLDVRVRLYGRGTHVGPLTDPVLQKLSRDLFACDMPLALDAGDIEVSHSGGGVTVQARSAAAEKFDYLLAATGRTPDVHQLNLAAAGLPLDPTGVPLFSRNSGQIGDTHVFIAGDADNDRPLLHEAADEGRIAGENAARYPELRVRVRRTPLAVVFTDPQLMMAGASYAHLTASGADFAVGEASFVDQGRSRVMARNLGALRVYGERSSGRFLGAEMVGPAAEHISHLLAWCAQRGDTVAHMLDYPFCHPVIEEGVRTALRALRRKLCMGPPPVAQCLDCGPGA